MNAKELVQACLDIETDKKYIRWQYCKNPNDINDAIYERDENWEGLESAKQIISITYDSSQGCYVVFWTL